MKTLKPRSPASTGYPRANVSRLAVSDSHHDLTIDGVRRFAARPPQRYVGPQFRVRTAEQSTGTPKMSDMNRILRRLEFISHPSSGHPLASLQSVARATTVLRLISSSTSLADVRVFATEDNGVRLQVKTPTGHVAVELRPGTHALLVSTDRATRSVRREYSRDAYAATWFAAQTV